MLIKVSVQQHQSGAWRVIWRDAQGRQYAAYFKGAKDLAHRIKAQVMLAVNGSDDFPAEIEESAAVRRWRAAAAGVNFAGTENILDRYRDYLVAGVSPRWVRVSLAIVRAWADAVGDISQADPEDAEKFLAAIARRRAVATRNQYLAVLGKFNKWLVANRLARANPFEQFKLQSIVRKNTAIKYLSREERARVLAVADGWNDALTLGVYIALYAGLRCNEIWRLDWAAVNMAEGNLVCQSKRGRVRTVPLAAALERKLDAVPLRSRTGAVAPYCGEMAARQETLRRLWAALPDMPRDLLRFNVFRHTFCSLLVQSGVSLDKVAMWAGHAPEVSRQHYARFIAKDRRDNDIDKL